jgi:hypothetical protein
MEPMMVEVRELSKEMMTVHWLTVWSELLWDHL